MQRLMMVFVLMVIIVASTPKQPEARGASCREEISDACLELIWSRLSRPPEESAIFVYSQGPVFYEPVLQAIRVGQAGEGYFCDLFSLPPTGLRVKWFPQPDEEQEIMIFRGQARAVPVLDIPSQGQPVLFSDYLAWVEKTGRRRSTKFWAEQLSLNQGGYFPCTPFARWALGTFQ